MLINVPGLFIKRANFKTIAFLTLDTCFLALGMEHGHIKDEDISASSAFDFKSVGPQNAR